MQMWLLLGESHLWDLIFRHGILIDPPKVVQGYSGEADNVNLLCDKNIFIVAGCMHSCIFVEK